MNTRAMIAKEYIRLHPTEAADCIERQSDPDVREQLAEFDDDALVALMDRLEPFQVKRVFELLDETGQNAVLERSSNRLALFILEELSDEVRRKLFERLTPTLVTDLKRLLAFPEDSAGHFMERTGESYRDSMLVGDVLEKLRRSRFLRARSIYVLDANDQLAGRVDMQELALSDSQTPVKKLLIPVECTTTVTAPRSDLVRLFDDYRLDSVPVLDREGRLMGVVRYGNLFDAVEEVVSADIQKMMGASADEKALSPALFAVSKRLPWLHINLLTAFLAASVVGLFEDLIAQFTALAILLPVVAGQSGNAGSQALAVTMRGLTLKEVGLRQWRQVLAKEIQIGMYDGLALAVTCGIGVYLWSQSLGLGLIIGVAMIVSMIAAGISGALVPMVLIRLGQDPATASSIILTTVTDVAGFFSFLGTATALAWMI